jgi:hypothetical protein
LSMLNPFSSVNIPDNTHINFSDFLNVPSICDSDVKQAVRLLSLKRIGAYDIPNVLKIAPIFLPFLNYIFNIIIPLCGIKRLFFPF